MSGLFAYVRPDFDGCHKIDSSNNLHCHYTWRTMTNLDHAKDPIPERPRGRRLPRPVLLGIGWTCVGIGFVGVFVPGLPTTTFLLIAAWCFYRSSPKAHQWLMEHRLLGPYVRDFLNGKGMPMRSKVIALTMIWLTCGSSAAFFIRPLWLRAVVLLCGVIGTVVILRVPTRQPEAAGS